MPSSPPSSISPALQSLGWLVLIGILGLTSWFGWKALRDAEPGKEGAGAGGGAPSVVIVKPAEEREVVEYLEVTGTLRAVRRSEVAARESAGLDAVEVEEGDKVAAGDIIARLDPRRLEAQLAEAKATLTAAEAQLAQRTAEHERAVQDEAMNRDLWEQKAVAEREYLDSLRGLRVAAAQENAAREAIVAAKKRLDLLEVRRGDLTIEAPFAGRVVARHAEVGEWLTEGSPVITLVSTGEAEAWLQLPERHVSLMRQTEPEAVQLRVSGTDGQIRADRMALVPDVDGRSRRFILIAHVPDPEDALTPGSSVQATVPLGRPASQVVVSADAVLQGYAGKYVFVPEGGEGGGPPRAKRVPVQVLFERQGESVLANGAIKAGDEVIVEGNERLFEGMPLAPSPWAETRAGKPTPEASS